MKNLRILLSLLLTLFFSTAGLTENPIQPATETAWITVGQVYRGEITADTPSPWFRFRVSQNRRYYIMVFPDFENGSNPTGIGDTKISITSNPDSPSAFRLENNDAPDWTQMGFGSFLMVEVMPHEAVCSYEGQRCGLKNQFRTSTEQAQLYLNVQWGEEAYPATGSFTIEVLSDDIPTMEVEGDDNETETVYKYGAGRESWLINGPVSRPEQTPISIITPGTFAITMSVNNQGPQYPIYIEADDTQTLIVRVKAKRTGDLKLEQFLVVCENIDNKCYYLEDGRWKVFNEITEIRPFSVGPLPKEPETIAAFPALMLLPAEVTFFYGYDPVADGMPDMDIATYTWASIVKK